MENIWAFLLQTLTASVAAAVLLIAKRLFLDKLSPRWQYGVWAILAVRLLLPAGLWGRTPLPGLSVAVEAAKTGAESHLSSALSSPYAATEVLAPIPLAGLTPPASLTDWLFYLYAAGVVVSLLWFFLSYLALRQRVAGGRAPSPAALEQVKAVAARYRLARPRRVVVLPGVESAFVCGPLARVLVLPEREVDGKVLLHELLHLQYGDLWAGVAMCALRCLHWCNPFLWFCWDRAQNDCEALCDQRVLERLEGEERREYGVILLSMADGRYARAPGTTSMANGGKNIKARISSIARFKRYPRGVGFGSGCVAAVLAIACLSGTSGAVDIPDFDQRGPLALARAQVNRPTTVAGALDTYAKALLSNSPLYYAMVAPEASRQAAVEAASAPYRESELDDYLYSAPFSDLGFRWHRPAWQAEWSVMNLLPDGAGGYTGVLFFTPFSYDETFGLAYQSVAVRPLGDYWTVEPTGELTAQLREDWWLCPSTSTPYATYTAEGEGLQVEVDFQCRLWVDNTVQTTSSDFFSSFSGSGFLDPKPLPHISFTQLRTGVGARLVSTETGEAISLPITVAPMKPGDDPVQALRESLYTFTLNPGSLDEDPVQASSGIMGGENLTLTEMPAALAVSIRAGADTYTWTATLEKGDQS